MTDRLNDIHHDFGEAIADLGSSLHAARRLAESLDADASETARALIWALQKAEAEARRIDQLHDDLDTAIMQPPKPAA